MDLVTRLVLDVKLSIHNNLHLVVGIFVDEGDTGFLAIEAAGDGGNIIGAWLFVRELGGSR